MDGVKEPLVRLLLLVVKPTHPPYHTPPPPHCLIDPKDSIFHTRSVEFHGDRVVTTRYMDDFPFPYYVALQRLEALPVRTIVTTTTTTATTTTTSKKYY